MGNVQTARKVLLVGWDAADWKIIHKLVDEGKMPNMARFVEGGVIGNLATIHPELSPMLWTSIATGKRPYKHGILGFTEPDPELGGIRPITNLSRKSKALWNILNQSGKKSIVVGWWPSHPAEPINGVMVSNHYQRAVAPYGKPWPMRQGTVHPERLVKNLAELRLHPQELDVELMMHFVPRLNEIDQEKDHRVEAIAKIVADCTTINRAATAIMHHEPWDFAAIYYDSIDHFGHGFMDYHPPRLSWISEKDYEFYRQVVESGYLYHDLLLGSLLEKAGDDAIVIIVSDHGFHSDHLRPRTIPAEPAGPFVQHRPYGIFAAKGPGIRKDELTYGASILDICPTVLSLFGLPVGRDMDGKPLIGIMSEEVKIDSILSWDEIPGNDGAHPPGLRIDPIEAKEAIDQLIELGYIAKPDENREKAARDCMRELNYNLARAHMDAGNYHEAIRILEVLFEEWPDQYRFGIHLVSCHQALDRISQAREVLETIIKRKEVNAKKAKKDMKSFLAERKELRPEDWPAEDRRKLHNLKNAAETNPFALDYLMGTLLLAEKREEEALLHFKAAEKIEKNAPDLFNRLGEVYFKMKRYDDAEKSFREALQKDPDNAAARLGLARTYLRRRWNRRAAEEALKAIGLLYHNPLAHYVLGTALHRMGRIHDAVQALHVAVAQNPTFPDAHRRLASIYRTRIGDAKSAVRHSELAKEARELIKGISSGKLAASSVDPKMLSMLAERPGKDAEIPDRPEAQATSFDLSSTVTIVSGLPRSGTSMMMQMLAAGGISPLTDGARRADDDNRKGYFEYEKATQLRTDNSWMPEAKGRAVKIVAQLLNDLPLIEGLQYRVVFMERNLDEVIRSQKTMLARNGKTGSKLPDERLKKVFSRQIDQVKRTLALRKIPVLFVDYHSTITDPEKTALRLNAFFSATLLELDMIAAVDPALRRQKISS